MINIKYKFFKLIKNIKNNKLFIKFIEKNIIIIIINFGKNFHN